MDHVVRHVAPADSPTWLAMRSALYTGIAQDFHLAEMGLYATADDKACLVACRADGALLGFIELSLRNVVDGCLSSPVGYIEGIYVVAEHRGCGVSRSLFDAALDWCRDHGCTEIATDAELENESAQRFHRHLGFEETYRVVQFRKSL